MMRRYYYLQDGQQSVTALTDPNGTTVATYTYDPYGQLTTMTGGAVAINNPWRYVGAYQDGTGLYHIGERYYDPSTGRLTQQDPAGVNPLDPGNWNPYVYSGDNPINYADLNGLKRHWWDSVGDFFSGLDWGQIGCDALYGTSIAAGVGAIFASGPASLAYAALSVGAGIGAAAMSDNGSVGGAVGEDATFAYLGGVAGGAADFAASRGLTAASSIASGIGVVQVINDLFNNPC